MKYYAVTCKHGHHGSRRYCPITFAVKAQSALEACDFAQAMPGVKHDQTVISCKEITLADYLAMRKQSAYERSMLK